ncbi:hypothetical protein TRIP_B250026 [uncultured Desulfatiglans sp.]|nr:hypothetical protein TRIP_B250026 [uncultured Desulfatiglans sp.]
MVGVRTRLAKPCGVQARRGQAGCGLLYPSPKDAIRSSEGDLLADRDGSGQNTPGDAQTKSIMPSYEAFKTPTQGVSAG